ncbi:MAG: hypothetical protein ISS57_17335 [Anaerolineales bacterium]|nr:hypothetical protein [Anaerolineales bacterium]
MTNITNSEQIEIWKNELAVAMTCEQWQLALKLCGLLRYALRQQEMSDPDVDKAHHQAKETLAKQIIQEKSAHEEHRQLRNMTMRQIISGEWEQALDSIEALYQDGVNGKEAIGLLQEIDVRTQTFLSPNRRLQNQRAAELGKRFDELVERIGDGSLEKRIKLHF